MLFAQKLTGVLFGFYRVMKLSVKKAEKKCFLIYRPRKKKKIFIFQ